MEETEAMGEDAHMLKMPSSTKRDLAAVNCSLATSVGLWLKKRGKAIRPKLSAEQKQQLKECFELMDQDGSGAIDAEELGAAFKLLGIRMKLSELEALLAEVDHDGSGEVEYLEFLEIMTTTLQRLAEERESEDSSNSEGQVPFALMATAYRRKRLMEGIISGDKEVMQQITQLSERQTAEAANAASRDEAEAAAARSKNSEQAQLRRMLNSITKRSLQRLAALRVDEDLLMNLSQEERRLLTQVVARAGTPTNSQSRRAARDRLDRLAPSHTLNRNPHEAAGSPWLMSAGASPATMARSYPSPGSLFPTGASRPGALSSLDTQRQVAGMSTLPSIATLPNKWQHYSTKARHQQLLELPRTFDLKFHKSTVKTVPGRTTGPEALPMPGVARGAVTYQEYKAGDV